MRKNNRKTESFLQWGVYWSSLKVKAKRKINRIQNTGARISEYPILNVEVVDYARYEIRNTR
jgi:hypothetical protein